MILKVDIKGQVGEMDVGKSYDRYFGPDPNKQVPFRFTVKAAKLNQDGTVQYYGDGEFEDSAVKFVMRHSRLSGGKELISYPLSPGGKA